jgi:hypothetical protein
VKQQGEIKDSTSEAMTDISNSRHPPRMKRDKEALSVDKKLFRLPLRQFLQIYLCIENLILSKYDKYSGNEIDIRLIKIKNKLTKITQK